MPRCPECGSILVGFSCRCGYISPISDATGYTGEDEYPYASDESPVGPYREEEDEPE